jgi:hypothetical protein
MSTIEALRTKIEALIPYMDEQPRGLWQEVKHWF